MDCGFELAHPSASKVMHSYTKNTHRSQVSLNNNNNNEARPTSGKEQLH
jgi:hypothetical protein